jgi:UDP-glucose 4-epimerase
MKVKMENKKIFLTGGTGFLGKQVIKKYYDKNQITVYSRDEAKQYYLKKQYPNIDCICGDIRNYDLMHRASKGHNVGIFAASFKQIQACHDNYEEANQVIVQGAFNSRRCAEENNFESACFISSDKSRSSTTIYGAMKYVAGESFISNSQKSSVRLSSVIYGNVLNSTGSILPLIWKSISEDFSLSLYGEEMTRFFIDVEDAVKLIEISLCYNGYNIIPNLKSMRIVDLFDIFKEEFGLKYSVSSPRSCEKIHEIMASQDEIPRMKMDNGVYLMHQDEVYNQLQFKNNQYSSSDCIINKQDLYEFLKSKDFYRPL